MTPDEGKRWILDALADLPSGPDGEEVLAGLLAQEWSDGWDKGWDAAQLAPKRNHRSVMETLRREMLAARLKVTLDRQLGRERKQ